MGNKTPVILADAEGIARAAQILRDGGLVAVPTETVYGLAARADSAEAVAKIYAAKGRPSFNPLIIHVRGREQAEEFAHFPQAAKRIAETYWPGPVTLVLPRKDAVPLAPAATAGLPTVALRVPNHPVMRTLFQEIDFPIAAPSANRSGFISPTSAEHVLESLDGRIDLVLDGGKCQAGVESEILAVREGGSVEELRPGPMDAFFPRPGETENPSDPEFVPHPFVPEFANSDRIEAPGQLASHYSPGKPVRLNVVEPAKDEYFIGFGELEGDFSLSQTGDLKLAASRLYAALHEAARSGLPRIAVAPVPDTAEGRAINDRLRRAAA